jgi:hypothetical protein
LLQSKEKKDTGEKEGCVVKKRRGSVELGKTLNQLRKSGKQWREKHVS